MLGVLGPSLPSFGVLYVGAAAFPSRLWPVRCLCSSGGGQLKEEIRKKENIAAAPLVYDLSLHHCPCVFSMFYSFLCYVFLATISVVHGSATRQHSGIYIQANFSIGFLTRKHILQFLSISVLLHASFRSRFTHKPPEAFSDFSASSLSSEPLHFPIFAIFSA